MWLEVECFFVVNLSSFKQLFRHMDKHGLSLQIYAEERPYSGPDVHYQRQRPNMPCLIMRYVVADRLKFANRLSTVQRRNRDFRDWLLKQHAGEATGLDGH